MTSACPFCQWVPVCTTPTRDTGDAFECYTIRLNNSGSHSKIKGMPFSVLLSLWTMSRKTYHFCGTLSLYLSTAAS